MTTPNPHPVMKLKKTAHESAPKLDKRNIKIMELSIEKQEAQIALPVTLPPEVASFILWKNDRVKVDNGLSRKESLLSQARQFMSE
jgi:hypothetical protein